MYIFFVFCLFWLTCGIQPMGYRQYVFPWSTARSGTSGPVSLCSDNRLAFEFVTCSKRFMLPSAQDPDQTARIRLISAQSSGSSSAHLAEPDKILIIGLTKQWYGILLVRGMEVLHHYAEQFIIRADLVLGFACILMWDSSLKMHG